MNKYFLLNPEKNYCRSVLSFSRKSKKRTLKSQKITSPSRRLCYSNSNRFRLGDVIFRDLSVHFFCVFLENDKTDLRQIFFSGFRRKHLFITIYIESTATGL